MFKTILSIAVYVAVIVALAYSINHTTLFDGFHALGCFLNSKCNQNN